MKHHHKTRWFTSILAIILFGWMGWMSLQTYLLQPPVLFGQNLPWIWYGTAAFVVILLIGQAYLLFSLFGKPFPHLNSSSVAHWLFRAVLYLVSIFIFVYCQNARMLLYSWVIPVYLLGIFGFEEFVTSDLPHQRGQAWWVKQILGGMGLFICIAAVQQLKLSIPGSPFWTVAYYGIIFLNGVLFSGILELIRPRTTNQRIFAVVSSKIARMHVLFIGLFLFLFTGFANWFFWYDITGIGAGIYLRLQVYLMLSLFLYLGLNNKGVLSFNLAKVCLSLAMTGYLFMAAGYLVNITNYPFSLTWSEGNRFYDYSIVFGQNLYQSVSEILPNYYSPGRYGLWGLPFLIPGLPISVHRAWNVFLYCVPGLILGWLLGRDWKDRNWRIALVFGTQIFLNQGPIYPTLTISLIFSLIFIRSKLPFQILGWILASLFAGISRFTWVLVIGAWAGLFDLLMNYPGRRGTWFKRLMPTIGMILVGVVPGMLVSWPEVMSSQGATIQSQASAPLWYRLMPNSTYSLGVFPGIVLATVFVVTILILLWRGKAWQPDGWQGAGVITVLLGFFAFCLFASAKIGGGSNLHNMDMYLVSLLLVVVLIGLGNQQKGSTKHTVSPILQGAILLAVIIPGWNGWWSAGPLNLPDGAQAQAAIQTVREAIDQVEPGGKVLFIDQRQLMTFGEISGVEFHPEYEKKFMMDQAMAGNEEYFNEFYADLKNHKYALIINETQKVRYQNSEFDFNEENNAWVKWVSEPFLQYYKPVETFKEFGFSIYRPK